MDEQIMFAFPLQLEQVKGRPLTVDIARPEDAQEIFEFLLCHFFPLAPIRQLGLYDESNEAKRPEWMQYGVINCVQTPYSLVVRDASVRNQIVAVAINEIQRRKLQVANHQPYAPKIKNPAQIPVGRLHKAVLEMINRDLDVFTAYKTETIMELNKLAVDGRYGRQGLATKLVELSLCIAKSQGAGAVWTKALSAYTAKVAFKFGFVILKSVNYEDFKYDGHFPLANIPGHRVAHVMARNM